MMNARTWIGIGAANMGLAVMLGAFGAHGLEARLAPRAMAVYETAFLYHALHALGMLALAALAQTGALPGPALRRAAGLLLAGIVLFSGSLYLLAITGVGWLGAVTPLGGLAFIGAWGLLVYAALHRA
jgi:uncharacterized membrane protein YgdD (TMEM256/DUF423 family)